MNKSKVLKLKGFRLDRIKRKLLYDITNIKERTSNYSVKTVSVTSSLPNNITDSNEDVNTIEDSYFKNLNKNK